MSQLENKARVFALEKHKNQRYAKVLSYGHHLAAVVGVLRRFGVDDPEILAAAWLHDVCEDQGVKTADLHELFTPNVSFYVWSVTNETGRNRKERNAKTYLKIAKKVETRVLKLADRIANVEACIRGFGVDPLFDMYEREHEGFKAAVFVHNDEYKRDESDKNWLLEDVRPIMRHNALRGIEALMWTELDSLMMVGRQLINEDR